MPQRNSIYWKFVVVTQAMERIKIVRRGRIHKAGTFQKGFTAHLTLGDTVYFKMPHRHWQKKFELTVRPDRGYAAIKFGRKYGPFPGQYRALSELPQEVFDNAGLIKS